MPLAVELRFRRQAAIGEPAVGKMAIGQTAVLLLDVLGEHTS